MSEEHAGLARAVWRPPTQGCGADARSTPNGMMRRPRLGQGPADSMIYGWSSQSSSLLKLVVVTLPSKSCMIGNVTVSSDLSLSHFALPLFSSTFSPSWALSLYLGAPMRTKVDRTSRSMSESLVSGRVTLSTSSSLHEIPGCRSGSTPRKKSSGVTFCLKTISYSGHARPSSISSTSPASLTSASAQISLGSDLALAFLGGAFFGGPIMPGDGPATLTGASRPYVDGGAETGGSGLESMASSASQAA
mmetsp:Transcript_51363/g.133473  ORF Transcript_51363/g.133473 Transcript_51363/m.133473 type:complete len:248 (+) Transcript_51363:240-983(+)